MAEKASDVVRTFEFTRDEFVEAPPDVVFAAILDECGPESQMPDGTPFPLKLEAWPGGRWFRDLGNNTGHFWGYVQVIKPGTLLELCGPAFMSYPATNFMQYRLTSERGGTKLTFTHKAMGMIPAQHLEGMEMGWGYKLGRVRELAEKRRAGR